jgi:hypothetical protein
MRLTHRDLAITMSIATIGMLSGCGLGSHGAASTPMSPADRAQAALARFIGSQKVPHGSWEATKTPAGPRLKTVILGLGIFEVDANTYQITEAVFDHRMMAGDGGKQPAISLSAAMGIAQEFATKNFGDFSALVGKEAELDDHGAFKQYSFTWQERDGEAWVPTFVNVTINPGTGGVNSYSAQVVPVSVTTRPSIADAQARAEAIAAAHLVGQVSIKSDGLQVVLHQDGSQELDWVYELTVVHSGNYIGLSSGDHVVQVNARNGIATQVAA